MAAALPILGKVAVGLVGSKLIGSIFGGKKDKTPAATPAAATPAVMPTPDDNAIQMARKRSIVLQMSRGGRASTMLTPTGSKLGG
jgi:hypothetical protein